MPPALARGVHSDPLGLWGTIADSWERRLFTPSWKENESGTQYAPDCPAGAAQCSWFGAYSQQCSGAAPPAFRSEATHSARDPAQASLGAVSPASSTVGDNHSLTFPALSFFLQILIVS